VTIATGTAVTGFDGNGQLEQVICDGLRLVADLVVVGVGAIPNSELARAAGLAVDNGIVVDGQFRTQDPAIQRHRRLRQPVAPAARPAPAA